MSWSYARYDRRQRRGNTQRNNNNWSYWLPVGITVVSAAVGLAAWAWNERRYASDEEEDETSTDRDDHYASPERGYGATTTQQASYTSQSVGEVNQTLEIRDVEQEQFQQQEQAGSVFGRVSDVVRRTPSPQQLFNGASKRVAAGVAAAGAVMGKGLTVLKESDEDFQDHETWADEAEKQGVEASGRGVTMMDSKPKKKRMICVVVSAADRSNSNSMGSAIEHAVRPGFSKLRTNALLIHFQSILSHLPLQVDSSTIDLMVLIYAPHLTSYPLPAQTSGASSPEALRPPPASSMASSYSNIAAEDANSDTEGFEKPNHNAYTSLQNAALRLVPHPTHVLPFTTPTGHIHLLRNLSPSLVYLQENLSGSDGEHVKQIEGWVGQVVVVVGGEGLGADTETEAESDNESSKPRRQEKRGDEWWKDESRIYLGGTQVVETERFEEDWIKRVGA